MLTGIKITLAAVILLALSSCEPIRDDYSDCGVWLEFIFDHNMEYTDSFDQQVKTVDVYLFDEDGIYVTTRHAAIDELHGRKRMFLDSGLPFGNYRILTVGSLGEHFRFAGADDGEPVPGVTTIRQVRLALHSGSVSREFPHLWFGPVTEIRYRADLSVWPVHLIRQTNKFHITLHHTVTLPRNYSRAAESLHTIEITAPESGAYDHQNNPLVRQSLVYRPHSLTAEVNSSESETVHLTAGKINTMRLLENEPDGYRLAVRNTETGSELWSCDLLPLLAGTKPAVRPDGTALPLQEYLDRQGEWNIVIIHGGTAGDAFGLLKVLVNGWIVWEHPVGV